LPVFVAGHVLPDDGAEQPGHDEVGRLGRARVAGVGEQRAEQGADAGQVASDGGAEARSSANADPERSSLGDHSMNDALRVRERWYSSRLQMDITVVRWGVLGVPVLVFPSAGGDAEEIERQGLVNACGPLLAEGRIKLYSVDSVAGHAMVAKLGSPEHRLWLLNQFHECVRWEVVPAIHADLGGPMDVIAAGPSIGAFNAVAVLCRYPDAFGAAVGMSGSYKIDRFYGGAWSQDLYYAAPLQFLPGLDGAHLDRLRQRRVILASGEGDWEDLSSSWQMAGVLGDKGIPNRVDNWGPQWPHEWHTWREMLPQYLRELT
jgi:esterase/lipase superfamily enzyme